MERRLVCPQCELALGGVAGEEIQDGGGEELLWLGQLAASETGGQGCEWGEDGVLGEGGWGGHFGGCAEKAVLMGGNGDVVVSGGVGALGVNVEGCSGGEDLCRSLGGTRKCFEDCRWEERWW